MTPGHEDEFCPFLAACDEHVFELIAQAGDIPPGMKLVVSSVVSSVD
jgi:hypothetical protein